VHLLRATKSAEAKTSKKAAQQMFSSQFFLNNFMNRIHQYLSNLLAFLFATSYACVLTPCQAQTSIESNTENINPISATDKIPSNLSDSSNTQPVVSKDSISEVSSSNPNPATNPNPRIPISSRIFRTPLMQQ
jgi:hypothetical protein